MLEQGLPPTPAWQDGLGTGKATALSSPQLCSWHWGQLRLGKQSIQSRCSPGGCAGRRESGGHGGPFRAQPSPIKLRAIPVPWAVAPSLLLGLLLQAPALPALGTGSQGLRPAPWFFTLSPYSQFCGLCSCPLDEWSTSPISSLDSGRA